jgi:predicted ArsR family transcriptional regulator
MGGDRVCPENCPLAVWAALSPKDRRAQRKPIAEELYKQGFTMEAIATQLGVSHPTIVRDLREFVRDEQIKPAKTASNPKGAGRPKGSKRRLSKRQQQNVDRNETIFSLFNQGVPIKEIAATVGTGERNVTLILDSVQKTEGAEIDRTTLSMSAQERLDAAIRQYKKNLDFQFAERVRLESMRLLNESTLPHYVRKIEAIERSIRTRQGRMSLIIFKKIRACLHPDRVTDADLKKRFEEAFNLFSDLEKYFLNEKDSPTAFEKMPQTYDDLMRWRAQARAERRARSRRVPA